jgi:hypothetical protein
MPANGLAGYDQGAVAWTIHTGPFPYVAPPFDGEIWLWRITNGEHHTAVTVKFSRSVCESDASTLDEPLRSARLMRGRTAVVSCFNWLEPPREIAFHDPDGPPTFWGGTKPSVTSPIQRR